MATRADLGATKTTATQYGSFTEIAIPIPRLVPGPCTGKKNDLIDFFRAIFLKTKNMIDHKDVIIVSVPYCEPLPLVAPVLLSACLENNGISAKGVDFNALFLDTFSDQSFYAEFKNFLVMGHLVSPKFTPKVFVKILKFTKKFFEDINSRHCPKYIGLSIFTAESLDFGLLMSYVIRKYLPGVKIIAGGKGLEVSKNNNERHYDVWINHNVADIIVVGDAEFALVDAIKQNATGLIFAKQQTKQDLDNVPLAKWDDYDLGIYQKLAQKIDSTATNQEPYLVVTASKGCVRQCTFCDVASFWPEYLYRDPEHVAQEIIVNYRKTGIKRFNFTDNLINGSISNFRKINEILVREIPMTIKYGGYAIFRGKNQMPEDDFALAARAGNDYWSIGVESGSEKIRYEMKKKFDNKDLDWSINNLYKYDIRQTWLLMVGYPSETEQDFNETKNLIKRYSHLRDKITVQITPTFMLLDNSPLITNPDLAEKYGLSHVQHTDSFRNKFWTSTKYLDNDYPTRSQRWKELVDLTKTEGYQFGPGMPVKKWIEEINQFDRLYHEQSTKIMPIYQIKRD